MEKILNLALKVADKAEVFRVQRINDLINFFNFGQTEKLHRELDEVSLRVIKDGRIGVAVGSMSDDPQALVDSAILASKYGPEATFDFPAEPGSKCGKNFDPIIEELDDLTMLNDGRNIQNYIKSRNPDLPLNIHINRQIKNISVANSSGLEQSYRQTIYTVCLMSMYKKSKEGINKELSQCRYFKFPEEKIDELLKEYELSSVICKVPTKKMPVIFRYSSTWTLIYRVLEGVGGMNLVRGITPLKDKLGEQIFHPMITILDDPTMDYSPGSIPFDDEGVPTAKKFIVEKGVLRNFLFDLQSAGMSKAKSTGNGIRRTMWTKEIEDPPVPWANNCVVLPGEWSLEEMIKDIPEGLLINDLIGFHSGNILLGLYSMNVGIGFYIKNGKVVGRAVDTMVAGNIYEDFLKIKGLGNKLEYNFLCYGPDFYFDSISVSGTG